MSQLPSDRLPRDAHPQGGLPLGPAQISQRAAIVTEAYEWVGTPYVHQASAIGQGTDCLGLIRGIWRSLYASEPEVPPPYTPGWGDGGETLLDAATRHLVRQNRRPIAGDVLLFRMEPNGPAKHCGVHIGDDRFIHAYSGRAVTAAWLSRFWQARLAATLSFPE